MDEAKNERTGGIIADYFLSLPTELINILTLAFEEVLLQGVNKL